MKMGNSNEEMSQNTLKLRCLRKQNLFSWNLEEEHFRVSKQEQWYNEF